PKLGKYHRTFCLKCNKKVEGELPITKCSLDANHRIVMGVKDRLKIIGDRDIDCHDIRPEYHYQVPLEFLPGVGPKTIDKLIDAFGTEMDILHSADYHNIANVVGD